MTASLLIIALTGCKGKEPPESPSGGAAEVCPRPAAGVSAPGDANGDGAVDVADAVLLLRHAAEAGPAPACLDAVDLLPDGQAQLDDAFSLLIALGEGLFALDEARADRCGDAPGLAPPEACAELDLRVESVTTPDADGKIELAVELRTALAVEGWQLRLAAEGCALAEADTAGTAGARRVEDAAGRRELGYERTRIVDGEARTLVVLGFMEPTALPPGEPWTLLRLWLDVGPEGCSLRLVEGSLAAAGAAWPLPATTVPLTTSGGSP